MENKQIQELDACPTFAQDGTVYIAGHSRGSTRFHAINSGLTTLSNWIFETNLMHTNRTFMTTNDYLYAINPDGTEKNGH
jgi:outer membrane protein assembly factor BamB